MKSNFNNIGYYIKQVGERNVDLSVNNLQGISIFKEFMPSVANIIGSDMSSYKVVHHGQFAYNPMHVGRDEVLPIRLLEENSDLIVSPAYTVFEIKNTAELYPEYLMMWFRRSEFDRRSWFTTDSSVRGGFSWESLCEMKIPVPDIEKQKTMVEDFTVIVNKFNFNKKIIQQLESTVQTTFNKLFIENSQTSNSVSLSQYVEINPKLNIKSNDLVSYVEMNDLATDSMCVNGFVKRPFTSGSKFQNNDTLLARITPCLENGKTGFVDFLNENEVGYGSTEFIVLRAKSEVNPYWVYCLARDEKFRSFAISSMVGSSGRQRVHENYLNNFILNEVIAKDIIYFEKLSRPLFEMIKLKSLENKNLLKLKQLILAKLASILN